MKIQNLSLTTISTIVAILVANNAPAQAQKFVDIIGNPPYGADPVNGVIGSGATPGSGTKITFADGVNDRVKAVSANLTAANISGTQSVGGNSIEVDPAAAETALAVINAPLNSNPAARDTLVTALGGGIPAQQLAQSMVGLRGGDGSIDPVILNGAVSAYNNYIKSLVSTSQVTQRSSSELDTYLRSLPPGQKAAQVLLGKLVAAAR
ncbi:hypothetical protein [Chamaesiphon sp. GL140_3_metabinner_50]|uniref:hypothetical protein n=1 Tax=Chamaesiphon sp. GL140_3_metabinner_50 TaxID=2970812 RepID=UPI0025D9A7FB|nr:hypothetical protein [Chamaesiphon sp. GL140_3_metabinner_50]